MPEVTLPHSVIPLFLRRSRRAWLPGPRYWHRQGFMRGQESGLHGRLPPGFCLQYTTRGRLALPSSFMLKHLSILRQSFRLTFQKEVVSLGFRQTGKKISGSAHCHLVSAERGKPSLPPHLPCLLPAVRRGKQISPADVTCSAMALAREGKLRREVFPGPLKFQLIRTPCPAAFPDGYQDDVHVFGGHLRWM